MTINSTDNWNFVLNAVMNKKEEWERIKRNKRITERGRFWGLDDHHVLYPVFYTPTLIRMMPRPGTQALLYLVPTK